MTTAVEDVLEPPKPQAFCTRTITGPDGKVISESKLTSGFVFNEGATATKKRAEPETATAAQRRYLIAICRAGSGRFENVSEDELLDVAFLFPYLPVQPLATWEKERFNE